MIGIVIIIGLIIIIGAIVTGICLYIVKTNKSSVVFVDKKYMKLIVEESEYFDNMNQLDLQARGASSKQVYKDRYINSVGVFNEKQKRVLQDLVDLANKYKSIWISGKWKFACISRDVENGFPHTLGDVIVLSKDFFEMPPKRQLITLVHEKIHVYQRFNPLKTNEYILKELHFEIKNVPSEISNKIRSNPDLNNIIYGKGDFAFAQVFKDNPVSLYDSFAAKINVKTGEISIASADEILPAKMINAGISQLEHPYEIMACYLPHQIIGGV